MSAKPTGMAPKGGGTARVSKVGSLAIEEEEQVGIEETPSIADEFGVAGEGEGDHSQAY